MAETVFLLTIMTLPLSPPAAHAQPAMQPHAFETDTPVTRDGVTIIAGDSRDLLQQAKAIAKAIRQASGVTVPVLSSSKACRPQTPFLSESLLPKHLILLGNLNLNPAFLQFYALGYAPIDRVWPGGDKIYLRTVPSAIEPGKNLIVVGASSLQGLQKAVDEFIARLPKPKTSGEIYRIPQMPELAARPGSPEATTLKKSFQGLNPRQYNSPSFKGFMGTHYGLPLFMDRWAQNVRSGAWTPEELVKEENTLLWCALANEGGYWRRADGKKIYSTHDVVGSLGYLQMVDYLLRIANPNDEARAALTRLRNETQSYFSQLCRVSQAEEETTEAVSNMHRAMLYAMRTGDAEYFSGGYSHAAALKALAYTDPLGGSIGTGTYGDASAEGFKKSPGGSFLWAVCAFYFRDGRYKWLLDNIGLPAAKAGYALYQALPIDPKGAGSYPTDDGVQPVRPDDWLACATPMDAYYYEKAQRSPRWATLEFPVSQAFTKVAVRDGWDKLDGFLALMGEHSGWVSGLDANSIIRYTDRGQIWLFHNTGRASLLHRNGVFVSRGDEVLPFPWGGRLKAIAAFAGGTFVASEVPQYNGADWTRHLFRRRREFTVVVDTLHLRKDGPYVLCCNWRTPHASAQLESGTFSCTSGGARFFLRPSEEIRQEILFPAGLTSVIQEGEGIPAYQLRQSKAVMARAGSHAAFQNVFYVNDAGEDRDLHLRRLDAYSVLLEGKTSAGPVRAFLAFARPTPPEPSRPGPRCHVGSFTSDGDFLYIGDDFSVAVNATYVQDGERFLFQSRKPKTMVLQALTLSAFQPPPSRSGPVAEENAVPPLMGPATPKLSLKPLARFDGFEKTGPVVRFGSVQSTTEPDGSLTMTFDLGQPVSLERALVLNWQDTDRLKLSVSNDAFAGDIRPIDSVFEKFTALEPSTKASIQPVPATRVSLSVTARYLRFTFTSPAKNKPPAVTASSVRLYASEPRRAGLSHLAAASFSENHDTLLAATEDGQLVALAADGSIRWRKQLGVRVHHLRGVFIPGPRPVELVLVGTGDGKLRAIGYDGTLLWEQAVKSQDTPAGQEGPFQSPYGVLGPVFSTAIWLPEKEGNWELACGQYAGANYLNLMGESTGNTWLYGAYQLAATPWGCDLDGDGRQEIAFAHNWGGISIVQGRLRHIREARRGPAYGIQGGAGSVESPRGRALFMDLGPAVPTGKPLALLVTEEGLGAYDLAAEKAVWEFPYFGPNVLARAEDLGEGRREIWVARADGFFVRLGPDGKSLGAIYLGEPAVGFARMSRAGYPPAALVATRTGLYLFDEHWNLAGYVSQPAQAAVTMPHGSDLLAAWVTESGEILILEHPGGTEL